MWCFYTDAVPFIIRKATLMLPFPSTSESHPSLVVDGENRHRYNDTTLTDGGGGGYSFVARLDHLTIDHASLSRRRGGAGRGEWATTTRRLVRTVGYNPTPSRRNSGCQLYGQPPTRKQHSSIWLAPVLQLKARAFPSCLLLLRPIRQVNLPECR